MNKKKRLMGDLEHYLADNPGDRDALLKREPVIRIASALLELRAALGLSQRDFAKLAGLLPSQLCEYENAATSGLTLQTLCRVAGAAQAALRIEFDLSVSGQDSGRVFVEMRTATSAASGKARFVARASSQRMAAVGIAA